MKIHRVLFAFALAVAVVACGGDDDDDGAADAPSTGGTSADTGAATTSGDTRTRRHGAADVAVDTTSGDTGGGGGGGELEMWERSGGNAPMVDALVAAWNEENPDRQINLTYIPHAEMVPKLAQAIASGDVPDLMGLDLIYGPQFASAGQLEDITDLIGDDPNLETIPEGHRAVATWEDRLYGVPLYADVSLLFWNKELFRQAGLDPEKPPTNLTELHDMAAAITALGDGNCGYYLPGNCSGCNIFTFAPMIWAAGGKIEPAECGDEALVGDNIAEVLAWARMMHQEGHIDPAAQAENGETFAEVFGSGKVGIMGTGNFNVVLAKEQNPDIDLGVTVLPGSGERSVLVVRRRRHRDRAQGLRAHRRCRGLHAVHPLRRGPGEPVRQVGQHDDPRRHGRQRVLQPGRGRGRHGAGPPDRPDAVHVEVLRDHQLAAEPVAADAPARLLHR